MSTVVEIALLCGTNACIWKCPLPEIIFVNILQVLLVLASCVVFCLTVRSQGVFTGRGEVGSNRVLRFWTFNALAPIIGLLGSVLPSRLFTEGTLKYLMGICTASMLVSCNVLCDEALIILKGIRLRGVRVLSILNYLWHAVAIALFLAHLGLGVFDLNGLDTAPRRVLTAITLPLDISMGIYMVIVMSLTFILNDAVPRSLPRAHLRTLWCLTFFIAFISFVKIVEIQEDLPAMWYQIDMWGRFRTYYAILAVISLVHFMISPAVIAGSLILLTLMTKVSEKSSRMPASSMTVPL